MNKVKWGVISTANIGLSKVIPGMQRSKFCEIAAISSRDINKAKAAADLLGIAKAYGSYEQLLADSDIDAIYIPLPNHLHVQWSVKALEAGKHVLCEKPLGLDAKDATRLVEAAAKYPNLKVMEAFMYRFHSQWEAVQAWVKTGKVGELKHVQSFFTYYNDDPENIRNKANIGGGALMDIGCYCISFARYLFASQPKRVMGVIEHDPVMKTDRISTGMLDFDVGTSGFLCSTQLMNYQRVQVLGTTGRIEMEIPVNAPPRAETRIWLHTDAGVEEKAIPGQDQYTLQADAFSLAILERVSVPISLNDSIKNMKVIDAVFESAATSSWISL